MKIGKNNIDVTNFLVITMALGVGTMGYLAIKHPDKHAEHFYERLDTIILAVVAFGKAESAKDNEVKDDHNDFGTFT